MISIPVCRKQCTTRFHCSQKGNVFVCIDTMGNHPGRRKVNERPSGSKLAIEARTACQPLVPLERHSYSQINSDGASSRFLQKQKIKINQSIKQKKNKRMFHQKLQPRHSHDSFDHRKLMSLGQPMAARSELAHNLSRIQSCKIAGLSPSSLQLFEPISVEMHRAAHLSPAAHGLCLDIERW
ncbi:uncharacterized protein BJX67DRAFT_149248 [Aspergillus lucknowensis]|uniref:Uncharacterized protein n=1 Tax=Aspergillus lucknowensis TaxID=176173 RepID=A0ABR4LND2_9EURO